ncbi:MAG TPA: beta-ketoacyl-ACP synthase II [Xanthobacteraceae bacterium]
MLGGQSGIGPITRFDVTAFPVRFGGQVRDFDVAQYMAQKDARRMDEFMHYGIAAGVQAVTDSGIDFSRTDPIRAGAVCGAGIGGLWTIEEQYEAYLEAMSPRKISPFFVPATIINMIAGHLSIRYGLKGPNLGVVTACTTSTHAIGLGMRAIQYGDADVIIAGGGEMATTRCGLGSFGQAKALSTRNDAPQEASRPWDKDRDGFVLSDGGGAVLLEELGHARSRGARIYAELVGFGMSGDAHHITAPPEDGEGARSAMVNALRDAGLNAAEVQYVNAHATSTQLGDAAETVAIKRAFEEHARRLAVSSTKSMTGHLLGAAGVVEAIFSVLAIRDNVAPPTINYRTPDPECDLDYVPNTARQMKIDVSLSNSFGFGGTNGSLIFRRFNA